MNFRIWERDKRQVAGLRAPALHPGEDVRAAGVEQKRAVAASSIRNLLQQIDGDSGPVVPKVGKTVIGADQQMAAVRRGKAVAGEEEEKHVAGAKARRLPLDGAKHGVRLGIGQDLDVEAPRGERPR